MYRSTALAASLCALIVPLGCTSAPVSATTNQHVVVQFEALPPLQTPPAPSGAETRLPAESAPEREPAPRPEAPATPQPVAAPESGPTGQPAPTPPSEEPTATADDPLIAETPPSMPAVESQPRTEPTVESPPVLAPAHQPPPETEPAAETHPLPEQSGTPRPIEQPEPKPPAPKPIATPTATLDLDGQRQLYQDMRQDIRDGSIERALERFDAASRFVTPQAGEGARAVHDDLILLSKYLEAQIRPRSGK